MVWQRAREMAHLTCAGRKDPERRLKRKKERDVPSFSSKKMRTDSRR